MADISTGMRVTGLSEYKNAMNQAKQSVKTLDLELKKNEAQYKANGDSEQYMLEKTRLLEQRLNAQKSSVKAAEDALKAMRDKGVNPTSQAFVKMEQDLARAQTGMLETQAALNGLTTGEAEAAKGADQLTASVNGISKKVSLEQVIGGIDKITSGLESAAKKAIDLGKALFENVMDRARWADDTATMALMYGVDLDTFLRMQKLVAEGMDTSVDAILNSRARLKRNIGSGSKDFKDVMKELGVSWEYLSTSGSDSLAKMVPRDADEVFWEVGQAIMNLTNAYKQEDMAQAAFGRSWKELVPLFTQYKSIDEFRKAMEGTTVNTEDEVNKLAELNDAVGALQSNFEVLETKVMAGLAPALTDASNALSGLLEKILEYLETDDGKKMLEGLSVAVEGLFEDLGKIDPKQVVEGFSSVFGTIVDNLKWLDENKETLGGVLTTIVGGWAMAKITGGALTVVQLVNGIRGLSAGAAAASAGAAAGASWGGAFASAVAAAAPWLVGLYTLLNPSDGKDKLGDNTLYNKDGTLAKEGEAVLNPDGSFKGEAALMADQRARQRNALEGLWDEYRRALSGSGDNQALSNAMSAVQTLFGGEKDLFESLMKQMHEWGSDGSWKDMADLPESFFEFTVEPKVDEGAAGKLAEEIGPVSVPVVFVPAAGPSTGRIRKPGGWVNPDGFNANGLPFVPFDGYVAMLHRGERVMPARENKSYTYNSNTYFGSVNLNNGLEVDSLADAIAKRNAKSRRGYGS